MHDLAIFRNNFDSIAAAPGHARQPLPSSTSSGSSTRRRRAAITETEQLKARRQRARAPRSANCGARAPIPPSGRSRCARSKSRDRRARRAGEGARRRSSANCWPAFPNVPHESVPVGKDADDNVEVRRVGEPRAVRFRAQGALGPGPGAGHPGSGARRQDHRRALRPLLGHGREAGARAHQFHARRAHARARLHRGAAALPGELRRACSAPASCPSSRRTCSSARGTISG